MSAAGHAALRPAGLRLAVCALVLATITAACRGAEPAPVSGRSRAPSMPTASAVPSPGRSQQASGPSEASAAAIPPSKTGPECSVDPAFPPLWGVPEASAAAEVELRRGVREILVVSDSGRSGAAMAWRTDTGALRSLTLPLDAAASDDVEGMAWLSDPSDGHLYTLTSSGAVRRYVADGAGGLRQDEGAYRVGPEPFSCADLRAANCGKNWEGLCLRGHDRPGRCAGYAASKAETALYCIVRDARGRLSIDPIRLPTRLALDRLLGDRAVLSDCAFGAEEGPADNILLVTTNVFGGSTTYRVDEATGRVTPLDIVTTPSNEAIAVDAQGAFYAFMDDNGDKSLAVRATCTGWGR